MSSSRLRPRLTELRTRHLVLRPATVPLLEAELAGGRALAAALGCVVPEGWPPGQHTLDAVRYFLEHPGRLEGGWADYYVITTAAAAAAATPATLVCSIGYQDVPRAGRVEVGYSVVESWRGRGIATEAVAALVERAHAHGLRSVFAHALPDNHASIAVLTKNRFRPGLSTREGELGFERLLFSVRRARAEELAEIDRLYRAIDFKPSKPADLQLVLDSGGALSGLGRLVPIGGQPGRQPGRPADGQLLELGGIWVAEHLRGEGCARSIVSALIEAAAGRPLACLPFSRLDSFYASFGFAPWDRREAPAAIQEKLAFCEATYDEPVSLMLRKAR